MSSHLHQANGPSAYGYSGWYLACSLKAMAGRSGLRWSNGTQYIIVNPSRSLDGQLVWRIRRQVRASAGAVDRHDHALVTRSGATDIPRRGSVSITASQNRRILQCPTQRKLRSHSITSGQWKLCLWGGRDRSTDLPAVRYPVNMVLAQLQSPHHAGPKFG